MPLKLDVQFQIVIYSLLAGVLTGILFDAYRLIRGRCNIKIVVLVEDVLFWGLCTLVVFTFLLYTNYAFLGPYVYLFIFLSLILYFKIVSRFIVTIEKKTARITYKVIRIKAKQISYPIRSFVDKIRK